MTKVMARTNHTSSKKASIAIKEFSAEKQIKLFSALRNQQFSGQIKLRSADGEKWKFYLSWGRLVYATGGNHAVKRWIRKVSNYCPKLHLGKEFLNYEISQLSEENSYPCWEYQLLCYWYEQEEISQKQVAQVISASMIEILFDITQVSKVFYEVSPLGALPKQLVLINAEQVIRQSDSLWKAWKEAKLADKSPNLAPVIKSPTEFKKRVPDSVYQSLSKRLDGQKTLRDLSDRLNRSELEIAQSLLPYIQAGLVGLSKVSDTEAPSSRLKSKKLFSTTPPLIACVDDSLAVCQSMEKVLTKSGYQVVTTQDPLRALALLLARKPDLIFLDLIMPNTNGYELCSHIRRIPAFQETPIIILTGNDGVIDRIRSKMVGASSFLGKPVEINVLLDVVRKHLNQRVNLST